MGGDLETNLSHMEIFNTSVNEASLKRDRDSFLASPAADCCLPCFCLHSPVLCWPLRCHRYSQEDIWENAPALLAKISLHSKELFA